jgi:hypothetical protein
MWPLEVYGVETQGHDTLARLWEDMLTGSLASQVAAECSRGSAARTPPARPRGLHGRAGGGDPLGSQRSAE